MGKPLRKYTQQFRRIAMQRMKSCDNIVALAQELRVPRGLLYRWREEALARQDGQAPPGNAPPAELRRQVGDLQRLLAQKTLELDFFKGALQKVAVRRQSSVTTGGKASTTKSKK